MADKKWSETVCCIGAGYVGGNTMAVIAKMCPDIKVTVVDVNKDRIAAWNTDFLPIFEPQLLETIQHSRKQGNLEFTNDCARGIRDSNIIFIAVDTPTKSYGRGAGKAFDMTSWEIVSRSIADAAESDKIIVEKSTVPVKTADKVRIILENNRRVKSVNFEIISNPEFLAEGSAIYNLEVPDRVLIGGKHTESGLNAIEKVAAVYRHWVPEEKIITTNLWSSELAKLSSNMLLAQRISSINAIAQICEETGADVEDISKVLGMDPRIGPKYLKASVGFGGSCLKKDVLALVYIAETYQLQTVAEYFKMVVTINESNKERFSIKILETMYGTVRRKRIVVLGFAFKADTADTRETPAVEVIKFLLQEGAHVIVYDPKVPHSEILEMTPGVEVSTNPLEAMNKSHGVVVITEWKEFKSYDWESIYHNMMKPAFLFDGRNILDHQKLKSIGFHVHGIGRRIMPHEVHIHL